MFVLVIPSPYQLKNH